MQASRSLSIRPKSRPSWLRPCDSTNILLAGRRQRPHLEGIQRLGEDSTSSGSLRCEVAHGGSFGRRAHDLLDSERQGHRDYGQQRARGTRGSPPPTDLPGRRPRRAATESLEPLPPRPTPPRLTSRSEPCPPAEKRSSAGGRNAGPA